MRDKLNNFQRCPGCGDFIILLAIKNAIKELNIPKENVVIVSWIWCSGKMSQYIDGYAAETLHGRILPFATGVKLSNPDLVVIWVWWDGDGYGIGLWHFMHTARRNIDITYIVCNNENYALTTGQASPTTPCKIHTKSTPDGNTTPPFDPTKLAEATWCQFTENWTSGDLAGLTDKIKRAIQHKWFAHLDVAQACPSWKRR